MFPILFMIVALALIAYLTLRIGKNILRSEWNDLAVNSFWLLVVGAITGISQAPLFS